MYCKLLFVVFSNVEHVGQSTWFEISVGVHNTPPCSVPVRFSGVGDNTTALYITHYILGQFIRNVSVYSCLDLCSTRSGNCNTKNRVY